MFCELAPIHLLAVNQLARLCQDSLFVLVRTRPVSKAHGPQPRLSAFAVSFLLLSGAASRSLDRPQSAVRRLTLLGDVLAAFALAWLGRSFSIPAEAQGLLTEGPYALIRHPLCAAEAIAAIGQLLRYASRCTGLSMVARLDFRSGGCATTSASCVRSIRDLRLTPPGHRS